MVWWYIAVFVVSTLVSIALAPKPPRPRPAALEDFDVPVAEEARPMPVVFGTCRITGPNVLWYGDLGTKAIKKSSLFGSSTVGYRYFLGLHFGLGHGPMDAITRVEVGDKIAWVGSVTTNSTINITQQGLFGGKKREGGLVGALDVMFGGSTQLANGYLTGRTGTPQPAYRGMMGLVWRNQTASAIVTGKSGGEIGNTSYLKPWAFTVRRITKGWQNDAVWYSAKATIGTSMNPAHILYQCLTDTSWGMGMPASSIDSAVWEDVADTLHAEGFGLDLLWNQSSSIEDFISIVLEHIGGMVRFNHETGKIDIRLIRGDYTPASLPHFNEADVARVTKFQRQAWGETVNEVTVTFTDPTNRKTTQTTVQDLANIRSQGAVIGERVDMPGISSAALAATVAQRELQSRSTPLAQITFEVNRRFWQYTPGDVIKFSWAKLGLVEVPLRISQVRRGTLQDGMIEVSAIEDIFGLSLATYTVVPPPDADTVVPDPPEDDPEDGNTVISVTVTAPPGSPADGDRYIVPAGATGAWAGQTGKLAVWNEELAVWEFFDVAPGTIVYATDTSTTQQVVGSTVSEFGGGPLTTKGDLMTRDATQVIRLPVGADDRILAADATEASGLKWIDRPTQQRGATWVRAADPIVAVDAPEVHVAVPKKAVIVGWHLSTDANGVAVVHVFKSVGLPYGPGDAIHGTAPPSISGSRHVAGAALTGWTTTVNAGDVLTFKLDTATGLRWIGVTLSMREVE